MIFVAHTNWSSGTATSQEFHRGHCAVRARPSSHRGRGPHSQTFRILVRKTHAFIARRLCVSSTALGTGGAILRSMRVLRASTSNPRCLVLLQRIYSLPCTQKSSMELLEFLSHQSSAGPRPLQSGNNPNYRAVPKHRSRNILPVRAGGIQNRFVPVEPLLNTAIRFRRRSSACMILQFQSHHMLRVPELARSAVCNSCERAATRWPPIRCEDRLPYYKHPHPSAGLPRQQLLSCGGPPQTSRSSRRQEQNQPRNVGLGIERFLELPEISFRQCDNRILATGRRAGTPQVPSRQQYKDCSYRHPYEPFFHFPENLSAMNAAISCGNRIIPNTTTRAVHRSTFPIMRPRIEHCLARCCCQKPKASSATDSPKSHGRNVMKKALAAPAPSAAAKPSGRQQLIVATALKVAASDAEMPVPCFKTSSPRGPR